MKESQNRLTRKNTRVQLRRSITRIVRADEQNGMTLLQNLQRFEVSNSLRVFLHNVGDAELTGDRFDALRRPTTARIACADEMELNCRRAGGLAITDLFYRGEKCSQSKSHGW